MTSKRPRGLSRDVPQGTFICGHGRNAVSLNATGFSREDFGKPMHKMRRITAQQAEKIRAGNIGSVFPGGLVWTAEFLTDEKSVLGADNSRLYVILRTRNDRGTTYDIPTLNLDQLAEKYSNVDLADVRKAETASEKRFENLRFVSRTASELPLYHYWEVPERNDEQTPNLNSTAIQPPVFPKERPTQPDALAIDENAADRQHAALKEQFGQALKSPDRKDHPPRIFDGHGIKGLENTIDPRSREFEHQMNYYSKALKAIPENVSLYEWMENEFPKARVYLLDSSIHDDLREIQNAQKEMYREMLRTNEFRHLRSNAVLKFTMAYYGLPVQPLTQKDLNEARKGESPLTGPRDPHAFDNDGDGEDNGAFFGTKVIWTTENPLEFLDTYHERSFGFPMLRRKLNPYYKSPDKVSQKGGGPVLRLRGGGKLPKVTDHQVRFEDEKPDKRMPDREVQKHLFGTSVDINVEDDLTEPKIKTEKKSGERQQQLPKVQDQSKKELEDELRALERNEANLSRQQPHLQQDNTSSPGAQESQARLKTFQERKRLVSSELEKRRSQEQQQPDLNQLTRGELGNELRSLQIEETDLQLGEQRLQRTGVQSSSELQDLQQRIKDVQERIKLVESEQQTRQRQAQTHQLQLKNMAASKPRNTIHDPDPNSEVENPSYRAWNKYMAEEQASAVLKHKSWTEPLSVHQPGRPPKAYIFGPAKEAMLFGGRAMPILYHHDSFRTPTQIAELEQELYRSRYDILQRKEMCVICDHTFPPGSLHEKEKADHIKRHQDAIESGGSCPMCDDRTYKFMTQEEKRKHITDTHVRVPPSQSFLENRPASGPTQVGFRSQNGSDSGQAGAKNNLGQMKNREEPISSGSITSANAILGNVRAQIEELRHASGELETHIDSRRSDLKTWESRAKTRMDSLSAQIAGQTNVLEDLKTRVEERKNELQAAPGTSAGGPTQEERKTDDGTIPPREHPIAAPPTRVSGNSARAEDRAEPRSATSEHMTSGPDSDEPSEYAPGSEDSDTSPTVTPTAQQPGGLPSPAAPAAPKRKRQRGPTGVAAGATPHPTPVVAETARDGASSEAFRLEVRVPTIATAGDADAADAGAMSAGAAGRGKGGAARGGRRGGSKAAPVGKSVGKSAGKSVGKSVGKRALAAEGVEAPRKGKRRRA